MLDESRIGDLLDGGPKPTVPQRRRRLRVWVPILVIAAADIAKSPSEPTGGLNRTAIPAAATASSTNI